MTPPSPDAKTRSTWLRVFLLCLAAYTLTWSGRITFPDDEIQFRTAESLYERGSFAIQPMDRRTGELRGRPTGSFGVAPNRHADDGSVYSFFGQGLAVAAVPFVPLGDALLAIDLELWRYATRSDTQRYAKRSPRGDLRRMAVTWSSCLWTALTTCVLGWWMLSLGLSLPAALFASLGYGLGTAAWPYTSTFLSEPLSALCLVGAFALAEAYKRAAPDSSRATRSLLAAAFVTGFSVHVHILNLLAVPFVLAYAWVPARRGGRLSNEAAVWRKALGLGATALVLLGLSQWWRFGSPFATGRFDHYAHWVLPFEALAAFAVAPGRSIFLYAPTVVLAFIGWRVAWQRFSFEMRCVLGLVALRALFAACRSDWSGGWSLGPRYLVPVIPLLFIPVAVAWEQSRPTRRRALVAIVVLAALVQAWLAAHAIAEHMLTLSNLEGVEHYGTISHWSWSSSPFAGFWRFDQRFREALMAFDHVQVMAVARFDMVSFGALRLALVAKDTSLLVVMTLWTGVGAIAGLSLLRSARGAPKTTD